MFFNNYCSVCAQNEICIGDGTIFGENVKIYDHNHVYKDPSVLIKHQGYTSAPIHIGKHCWIGSNVTILKGVTIGDNCVIGAGCVFIKMCRLTVLLLTSRIRKQRQSPTTFCPEIWNSQGKLLSLASIDD